ncbi:hypothetical protein [Synechococcus sp. GEYO]|uniref:hypothetical protein n=1 Tax=Synechococcus sp. GEYO TaxID=2575511 RepID=UPI000E0F2BAA|nr:hypothetical protein [Synechococcus sp. GEYO]
MLRRLSIALLTLSVAISLLPLRAQERAPSDTEMAEFNQNFLDTMVEFANDKEVSEFLSIFSVISLAIYNCELVAKGIVKPSAVDKLLSQYYLDIYDLPSRDMAIRMQSSALSDYIVFPKMSLDFATQSGFYRNSKAFR